MHGVWGLVWQGGVHGGGHAWQGHALQGCVCGGGMHGKGGCVAGGMHGRGCVCGKGVCVVGACMAGGMHSGGMCDRGPCMTGGVYGRYYEIRSMSGRYASYWNAFLLINNFELKIVLSVNTPSVRAAATARNNGEFTLTESDTHKVPKQGPVSVTAFVSVLVQ